MPYTSTLDSGSSLSRSCHAMRKLKIAYMERPSVVVLTNSPIKDPDNRQPIPDT